MAKLETHSIILHKYNKKIYKNCCWCCLKNAKNEKQQKYVLSIINALHFLYWKIVVPHKINTIYVFFVVFIFVYKY